MASSGVTVSATGSASEASEVPDNVGDWLRGVYRFATDRNDFRREWNSCVFKLSKDSTLSVTTTRYYPNGS